MVVTYVDWCRVSLLLMFVCGLGFVWCGVLLGVFLRGLLFFPIQDACVIFYHLRYTYVALSISILVQDCFSGSLLFLLVAEPLSHVMNVKQTTLGRRRRCMGRVRFGPIVKYDMGYVLQLHHARSNRIKANDINFVTHVLLYIFINLFFYGFFCQACLQK